MLLVGSGGAGVAKWAQKGAMRSMGSVHGGALISLIEGLMSLVTTVTTGVGNVV